MQCSLLFICCCSIDHTCCCSCCCSSSCCCIQTDAKSCLRKATRRLWLAPTEGTDGKRKSRRVTLQRERGTSIRTPMKYILASYIQPRQHQYRWYSYSWCAVLQLLRTNRDKYIPRYPSTSNQVCLATHHKLKFGGTRGGKTRHHLTCVPSLPFPP